MYRRSPFGMLVSLIDACTQSMLAFALSVNRKMKITK